MGGLVKKLIIPLLGTYICFNFFSPNLYSYFAYAEQNQKKVNESLVEEEKERYPASSSPSQNIALYEHYSKNHLEYFEKMINSNLKVRTSQIIATRAQKKTKFVMEERRKLGIGIEEKIKGFLEEIDLESEEIISSIDDMAKESINNSKTFFNKNISEEEKENFEKQSRRVVAKNIYKKEKILKNYFDDLLENYHNSVKKVVDDFSYELDEKIEFFSTE